MPRKKMTEHEKVMSLTVRPDPEQRRRLAQVSADLTVQEGKSVSFPMALLCVLDRYYEEKYEERNQKGSKAKA